MALRFNVQLTLDPSGYVSGAKRAGVAGKQLGTATGKVSADLSRLKQALIGIGLLRFGREAQRLATDFDTAFTRINTLVGVSRDITEAWKSEVRAIGRETGRGPVELSQALYNITSAGMDGAEALDVLAASSKAAAIGLGQTGDVARAVTAAVQAYGKENLSAASAVDVLVGIVKTGAAEADEVASTLGRVVGIAAQVGVSFQEAGAFIATFTRLGVNAEEAVTALRGVLSGLLGPTNQQQEALALVGMSMADLRDEITTKGLTVALVELVEKFKGNEDALAAIIPNVRALAGVLGTAGSQGESFIQVVKDIEDGIGNVTDEAFELNKADPGFVFEQFKATLQDALLTIGKEMLPALVDLAKQLKTMAEDGTAERIGETLGKALELVAEHLDDIIFLFKAWLALKVVTTLVGWGTATVNLARNLKTLQLALGPIVAGLTLLGMAAQEALNRWSAASERAIAKIVRDTKAFQDATSELRDVVRRAASGETVFVRKESLDRAQALIDGLTQEMDKLQDKMRETDSVSDFKNMKKELEELGNRRVSLMRLKDAAEELPIVFEETIDVLAGTGDAAGEMGEDLAKAVDEMKASTAASQALLDALIDSSEQYEILNTLLDAGIPLNKALSGAYDEQAQALNRAAAALEKELELREEEKELLTSILDLREKIGRARESAAFGPIDMPDLEMESVVFDVPGTAEVAAAVEAMRRSEEERREITAEIARLLGEGKISIEEAAKVARDLGVEFEHWTTTLIQGFDSLALAVGRFDQDLARAVSRAADLLALYQQVGKELTTMQAAGAVAGNIAGAENAGYAAAGAVVGAVIGAIVGSIVPGIGTAVGAKWGAVIGSWLGGMIKKGVPDFYAEIKATVGQAFLGRSPQGGGFGVIAAAVGDQITRTIDDILFMAGATLQGIGGGVTISRRRGWSVFVDGVLHYFEDNAQAAVEFAITQALKRATLTGAAPEIVAALKNTIATTLDELERDLQDAIKIRDINLGDVERAFRNIAQEMDYLRKRAEELGMGLRELNKIATAEVRAFGDLRNQILGIQEDPATRIRRQAAMFNAELELRKADLQSKKMALEAEAALLRWQLELEKQGVEVGSARLQAMAALLGIEAELAQAMFGLVNSAAESLEELLGRIAAIDKILAGLEGLEITEIDIAGAIARAGGGGTRKADMESLRDLLDQMRFDRLLADMTELEAGLARLEREYQANLEKAHGNAELIAQLTEEYRLQEEQLRRQIQLSAVDTFQGFMGIGEDPFAQLGEGFEGAVSAIEDAGFGAQRTRLMVARLTDEYERQLNVLSRQEFVAIGDSLMGIVDRYFSGVEGFEEFRMRLEQTRFELELANLRARFEILKAEGTLAQAVLDQIQGVFDFIDENPIDWGKFVMPSAPQVQRAARDVNNAFEEMARRLKSAKESIRDFLASLQTGAFGGRSNKQMFEAAQSQFQKIRQGVQAGNIQAIEQFPEVARRFLGIARERFGSTAKFQEILAQVESAGIGALGVTKVRDDNVVFDQRFFQQQAHHVQVDKSGHKSVADAVKQGFALQAAEEERSREDILLELRGLRESQEALNQRLAAIEGSRRVRKAS